MPKVGDIVHIYTMYGQSEFNDTWGVVQYVNEDTGEMRGTWGDCSLERSDDFEIIDSSNT
jgi:hypothetical protein